MVAGEDPPECTKTLSRVRSDESTIAFVMADVNKRRADRDFECRKTGLQQSLASSSRALKFAKDDLRDDRIQYKYPKFACSLQFTSNPDITDLKVSPDGTLQYP